MKIPHLDQPKERIVVGPGHEGLYVGLHEAIQQRMRQAVGKTTQDYPQG